MNYTISCYCTGSYSVIRVSISVIKVISLVLLPAKIQIDSFFCAPDWCITETESDKASE